MKKWIVILLALLLLAVPVSATGYQVADFEGLLTEQERAELDALYAAYQDTQGICVALVTVPSLQGATAEEYALYHYADMDYPPDGVILLVSLGEGEWYIQPSGECYDIIPQQQFQQMGEEVADLIREGAYFDAFVLFGQLAEDAYVENGGIGYGEVEPEAYEESYPDEGEVTYVPKKNYGKTIAISMAVGLVIGLITVGVMAARMKSVHMQQAAGDYVCQDSMRLSVQRDIFLYSHVTRTPRPKSNSGSHGSSGSRGGAGGKL